MIKILVAGQTPPPFHGQAVMIQEMLNGSYDRVKLYPVRMSFSREIDDIGTFQVRKILHLFLVIAKIIFYKFKYRIQILYYPPAGPDKIPIMRDLIILSCTRWLFKHVIFHFHAAGVSTMYEKMSLFWKLLYKKFYFSPDIAIRLSEYNPDDSHFMQAQKEFIVPNGVTDYQEHFVQTTEQKQSPFQILYVGVITRTKGIMVLVEACRILKEKNLDFNVNIVGGFDSELFRQRVEARIHKSNLGDNFTFHGVLIENDKNRQYDQADLFCYPTYYESETFSIVLLEAMQFFTPVVTTRWRGVQSVVREGENGFLVPIKDSVALAEKIELMMKNPDLRLKMAQRGRQIFLQEYTIQTFQKNMEKVFLSLDHP
ncbi:glycosyltransferase [candidate division CSSED10-310 bacterium]|uniref:Glycosyltransferase n=1 Tax=candidate division CSSED10-310 bacterium TaxID=2855610 RepID=A0ABV6YRR0_UNCC1